MAAPHEHVIRAQVEGGAIPPLTGLAPLSADNLLALTLKARGARYGTFQSNARVAQELKAIVRKAEAWERMAPNQQEAVDMILSKISRLTTGDPNYIDNWHDIAGYSQLIEDWLKDLNS